MGPAAAQTEDVSNPLKPFDLSKTWAMRVLDEFFQQGESWQILAVGKKDEEKGVSMSQPVWPGSWCTLG